MTHLKVSISGNPIFWRAEIVTPDKTEVIENYDEQDLIEAIAQSLGATVEVSYDEKSR